MNKEIILENMEIEGKNIFLTINVDNESKVFEASFSDDRSTLKLSEDLDILLMRKEFYSHRDLFRVISDFRNGEFVMFPVNLSKKIKQHQ